MDFRILRTSPVVLPDDVAIPFDDREKCKSKDILQYRYPLSNEELSDWLNVPVVNESDLYVNTCMGHNYSKDEYKIKKRELEIELASVKNEYNDLLLRIQRFNEQGVFARLINNIKTTSGVG